MLEYTERRRKDPSIHSPRSRRRGRSPEEGTVEKRVHERREQLTISTRGKNDFKTCRKKNVISPHLQASSDERMKREGKRREGKKRRREKKRREKEEKGIKAQVLS